MNAESQKRKIQRFLRDGTNANIDTSCIYQWIERCHFEGWWDLAVQLSSSVPPNSLDGHYHKRLDFLVSDCRDKSAKPPRIEPIRIYVPESHSHKDLTGTKVNGFEFEGTRYRAESHKDVFMKVLEIVAKRHSDGIERLLQVRGAKRKYFSTDRSHLTGQVERIEGTRIYAELKQNANTLFKVGREALKVFGMAYETFRIITIKL